MQLPRKGAARTRSRSVRFVRVAVHPRRPRAAAVSLERTRSMPRFNASTSAEIAYSSRSSLIIRTYCDAFCFVTGVSG